MTGARWCVRFIEENFAHEAGAWRSWRLAGCACKAENSFIVIFSLGTCVCVCARACLCWRRETSARLAAGCNKLAERGGRERTSAAPTSVRKTRSPAETKTRLTRQVVNFRLFSDRRVLFAFSAPGPQFACAPASRPKVRTKGIKTPPTLLAPQVGAQ